MQVEKTHFLDASEQHADGTYDYHYEGDDYILTLEGMIYRGRSYRDTPQVFHFLTRERHGGTHGLLRFFTAKNGRFRNIPYRDHRFHHCIAVLKHDYGFTHFTVLTGRGNGYETVDLTKLP